TASSPPNSSSRRRCDEHKHREGCRCRGFDRSLDRRKACGLEGEVCKLLTDRRLSPRRYIGGRKKRGRCGGRSSAESISGLGGPRPQGEASLSKEVCRRYQGAGERACGRRNDG